MHTRTGVDRKAKSKASQRRATSQGNGYYGGRFWGQMPTKANYTDKSIALGGGGSHERTRLSAVSLFCGKLQ
jgi:hypothetical protein